MSLKSIGRAAICLCVSFLLLTGCRVGSGAGAMPVLQFSEAPLTLTSGEFVLSGRLTYGGTDGFILSVESPESIGGCTFSSLGGELSVSFGSVRLTPAETADEGCVQALFEAIRSFESQEAVFSDGSWCLEAENLRLTCDEKGKVLTIEQTQSGWTAVFR